MQAIEPSEPLSVQQWKKNQTFNKLHRLSGKHKFRTSHNLLLHEPFLSYNPKNNWKTKFWAKFPQHLKFWIDNSSFSQFLKSHFFQKSEFDEKLLSIQTGFGAIHPVKTKTVSFLVLFQKTRN